jgi:tetratricopeptide (TPR) repeat protein
MTKRLVPLVLAVLGAVLPAAARAQTAALPDTEQAEFSLFEGETYLEEGKVREAVDSFSKVVALDPTNMEARLVYAEALARGLQERLFEDVEGTAKLAVEQYDIVLKNDPANGVARAGRDYLAAVYLREQTPPLRSPEAQAAWEEGKKALDAKDYTRARRAFERAAKIEPESAAARAAVGEAYRAGGRYRDAVRSFEQALTLDDAFIPAYIGLGASRAADNDTAGALEAFGAALDRDGGAQPAAQGIVEILQARGEAGRTPADLILLGRAELALERPDLALPPLEAASAGDTSLVLRRTLGIARFLAGQPEAAIPLLQGARDESPKDLEVLYYLAVAHLRIGEVEKGRAFLHEILDIEPQNPNALRVLGLSLLDDPDRAQDALDTLLAAHAAGANIDGFSCLMGSLYYRLEQPTKARMAWESCLRENPDMPAAHLGLGVLADDRGDTRSAIDHFEAYLGKADHPDRAAIFRLGVAYLRSGQDAKGFATLRRMVRPDTTAAGGDSTAAGGTAPADTSGLSDAALLEATSYFLASSRRYEDAIFIGEMLLTRDPGNAVYNNNLAMSYADADRELGRAYALAVKANRLDPDNPGHLDTLGWTLLRLGRLEEAEKALLRSVALAKKENIENISEIEYHVGFLYHEMGKHEEAVAALNRALVDPPTPYLRSEIQRILDMERDAAGSR